MERHEGFVAVSELGAVKHLGKIDTRTPLSEVVQCGCPVARAGGGRRVEICRRWTVAGDFLRASLHDR